MQEWSERARRDSPKQHVDRVNIGAILNTSQTISKQQRRRSTRYEMGQNVPGDVFDSRHPLHTPKRLIGDDRSFLFRAVSMAYRVKLNSTSDHGHNSGIFTAAKVIVALLSINVPGAGVCAHTFQLLSITCMRPCPLASTESVKKIASVVSA